ncbi:MAG TPA: serine/threonine-protein kinase [Streptosporangiaceae bacterium]|nr:serine/threonine-protein kinase [Streptosporangiaceae bacterium]
MSAETTCRYRFDEQIAAGGFGEVWRGTDVTLGRTVAIKLLRPECAQDPATFARFRAEARNAASLCHPNIASIHDFCEPPPPAAPFLVMEYVPGPSLAALLAGGPLSTAAAMRVLAEAALGLAAAHRAGLVHRDIKPSNLLLDRDGRVKITDFGISHAAGSAPLTTTGVLIGTPAYMAPERIAGARGSPASDIYSLGVVAYHAVTGAVPFSGEPLEVAVAQREQPLPPLPESVPHDVTALILQLTAKEPAARPAHAWDVARRAGRLCDELTASRSPFPHGTRPRRTGSARVSRRAAAASAAIVLTAAGAFLAVNAGSAADPSAAAAALPSTALPGQALPGRSLAASTSRAHGAERKARGGPARAGGPASTAHHSPRSGAGHVVTPKERGPHRGGGDEGGGHGGGRDGAGDS